VRRCCDKSIGTLLHAYELRVLTEQDTERFEIHLLQCDFCSHQVELFQREAAMLRNDDDVAWITPRYIPTESTESKEATRVYCSKLDVADPIILEHESCPEIPPQRSGNLWRFLWPNAPFIFKPALAYLLVLLLAIPFVYSHLESRDDFRVVQVITFVSDSKATDNERVLHISNGDIGYIEVCVDNAKQGDTYRFSIYAPGKSVAIAELESDKLDESGVIRLELSLENISPGMYTFTVTNVIPGSEFEERSYNFHIVE